MVDEIRTHFFYEIVGRKVGCTDNLKRRIKQHRRQGETRPVELLFELMCDDQLASDVEWNLADLFGYPRGSYYATNNWSVRVSSEVCSENGKKLTPEQRSKAAKAGGMRGGLVVGRRNVESGHLRRIGVLGGKVAGRKAVESGRLRQVASLGAKVANSKLKCCETHSYTTTSAHMGIHVKKHARTCEVVVLTEDDLRTVAYRNRKPRRTGRGPRATCMTCGVTSHLGAITRFHRKLGCNIQRVS